MSARVFFCVRLGREPSVGRHFRILKLTPALLCMLTLPAAVVAQSVDSTEQPTQGASAPQLPESLWGVEFAGSVFVESWDMNRFRERLGGAVVGVSRQMTSRWRLGLETNLLYVKQQPLGDVFLPSLCLMVRVGMFEVGKTVVFAEVGAGASYASNEVPNHGTRFNLVSQTGVGVSRPVSASVDFVGGARWLHVSNNSLDGASRNPDIQALGVYVGWRLH